MNVTVYATSQARQQDSLKLSQLPRLNTFYSQASNEDEELDAAKLATQLRKVRESSYLSASTSLFLVR